MFKKRKEYNQRKIKGMDYGCTIVTFLNILRNDFKVNVRDDIIISFSYYLEKIGVFLRASGAVFAIIYPAMVKYINTRYGINLKIKTSSITSGLSDNNTWGLGLKKLTTKGQVLGTIDGIFDKGDVDLAITYKNAYGHNHAWKDGIIIDSYNGVLYKTSLDVLKYGVTKDLYYDTGRTVVAGDSFTSALQTKLIEKYRFTGREATLEEFTYILKEMKYGNK